ncbi:MAG: cytochrome c biogenesis heme-transporting ATPase CcmA [Bdellovibrionales bacterium]|nr:cytochrome c biogenesis heme-transporting ATPase CcmA [Ramlibacter sp.]
MDQLTCVRGGRTLFSGLSRPVRAGELLRVKGANGAGKTSLLRMLCGLMEPAQGQVLWRGRKISAQRDSFGRDLVYLGHAAALKDELSPLENLQTACMLAGHAVSTGDARRALDDAGLKGYHGVPARKLSQGQRRRSALARLALTPAANATPLWILDEPFNALDAAATDWLTGQVRLQLQRGGVVVLTSHQDLALDGEPQQVLAL